MFRKIGFSVVFVILLGLFAIGTSTVVGKAYPDVIPLPNGLQPEGITVGYGNTFYTGEIFSGTIIKGDLNTGEIEILTQQTDRAALGMAFDQRSGLLFVAGGPTGSAFIYDGSTGDDAAVYQLSPPGSAFVNDLIITKTAAYFTDSFQKQIYRLPLGVRGELPEPSQVETIPLSGDFQFLPGEFNANGIEAAENGKALILINSTAGELYKLDPESGATSLIDLNGDFVYNGDGLVLYGARLYVVQNFFNQIAVIDLDPSLTSGEITNYLTSDYFRIPTTAAAFGDALYAVNARFDEISPGTAQPSDTFEVVRIDIH